MVVVVLLVGFFQTTKIRPSPDVLDIDQKADQTIERTETETGKNGFIYAYERSTGDILNALPSASAFRPLSTTASERGSRLTETEEQPVTSSSFPIPNFYNNRSYTYKQTYAYTCSYNLLAPVCHEWVVLFPFVKDPIDWDGTGGGG